MFGLRQSFLILYGIPEAQEVSKNLPGAHGFVWLNMSPWRAMVTTFVPEMTNFLRSAGLACAVFRCQIRAVLRDQTCAVLTFVAQVHNVLRSCRM